MTLLSRLLVHKARHRRQAQPCIRISLTVSGVSIEQGRG